MRIRCPKCSTSSNKNVQIYEAKAYCFKCGYMFKDDDYKDLVAGKIIEIEKEYKIELKEKFSIMTRFLDMFKGAEETAGFEYLKSRGFSKGLIKKMKIKFVDPMEYLLNCDKLVRELYQEQLEKNSEVMDDMIRKFTACGLCTIYNSGEERAFKIFKRYAKKRIEFYMFPAMLNGKCFRIKARGVLMDSDEEPRFLCTKGQCYLPYNADVIFNKRKIYITESETDCLTLLEHGFDAIAIPSATGFKESWALLFRGKEVILCLDNDEAGQKGTDKILEIFEKYRLRKPSVLKLPSGTKDISEYFGNLKATMRQLNH